MKQTYLTLVISILLCSLSYSATIELTVPEAAGVARSEYITHGVPLARADNVTSTSTMSITTDAAGNSELDAQFHVLSRYDDTPDGTGAIRVVLVTFAATVSADSTATYYLQTSGGSGTVSGTDIISEDATHHIVSTGALTAGIKKAAGFNLFDYVTVDSVNIIDTTATDGVVLRDGYADVTYASYLSNDAPVVEIDYNGPLYAVLSVSGNLEDASNNPLYPTHALYSGDSEVTYTVRFKVYKNERRVNTEFVLKNENRAWAGTTQGNIHSLNIDYMYLRSTLAGLGTPTSVRFGAGVDGGASFEDTTAPSGVYSVAQSHPAHDNDATTADDFTIMTYDVGVLGAETTNSADRFDSYSQIRDANRGLMVASRYFWENYWDNIDLDSTNKTVDFYLMADVPFDQLFLGGQYKTWEIVYDFHGDVASDYAFEAELAALKDRLYLFSDNFVSSNFFEFMPGDLSEFDPGVTWTNSGLTEDLRSAVYIWDRTNLAKFDSSLVQNQTTDTVDIDERRQHRRETWGTGIYTGNYMQWYGWRDFGGLVRDGGAWGYNSQHYNWDYLALRTAYTYRRTDVLDLAHQLTLTHGDLLTMHDPEGQPNDATSTGGLSALSTHGSQRYERDAHAQGGNFINQVSGADNDPEFYAHQWTTGLVFEYLMTGSPHSLDVIEDVGENLKYTFSDIEVNGYRRGTDVGDTGLVCYDPDGVVDVCYATTSENRNYTRGVESALHLYHLTGNPDFLAISKGIFMKGFLPNEQDDRGILPYGSAKDWTCDLPADSHLFYDSLKIKGIIDLWYALENVGDPDASEVYDFAVRLGNWMKDENYTNWDDVDIQDCGIYEGTGYWPYTTMNDWTPGCEWTIANTTIAPNRGYSVPFADLYAFIYVRTGDSSWWDLARKIFFDYQMYNGARKDTEPINEESITEVPINAIDNTPSDTWAKSGMTSEKPAYYLAVEAGVVQEPEPLPPQEPTWQWQFTTD